MIADLLFLWFAGLGFSMIIRQRAGFESYIRRTWDTIMWVFFFVWNNVGRIVLFVLRTIRDFLNWLWTRYPSQIICLLVGILIGILLAKWYH